MSYDDFYISLIMKLLTLILI